MMTCQRTLKLVLDLARARTLVLRDVDHPLGSHHGLGLNDLAVLLELKRHPGRRCGASSWLAALR